MKNEKSDSPELEKLIQDITALNKRISALEMSFQNLNSVDSNIAEVKHVDPESEFKINLPFQTEGAIEFRIGEYGMAWLGNIVLLFGITFLVQYLQNSGYPVVSVLAGFISISLIYLVAFFIRKSYTYLSRLFNYSGHLLLFYFSLRLHFFETNPILQNQFVGIIIPLFVVGLLFFLAFRQKSQILTFLVLLMLIFTGIVTNSTLLLASIATIIAFYAVILYYRLAWIKLYFIAIILVYFTHLNWLLNNPFMGNTLELIQNPGISIVSIFISGFVFSLIAFLSKKDEVSNEFVIATIVFNGLSFSLLLLITGFSYYQNNYVLLFATITVFCLLFSIVLKKRSKHQIIASMYVLYGFLAMSVSFYGLFLLPKAYLFFSLQSLIVVSMALWFRSRFIVIMNTILFIILMVFYLENQFHVNSSNFSFMLVAFIAARILNWKKERLNIQTELVRNVYLICGFVMTLFAFYYAFPEAYITVSWILAAILFFLLSRLIKNIKYRWLAIAAVIASTIKLTFVDLSSIDIGYRVLIFLLLAVISISVSIFYTKHLKSRSPLIEK